VMRLPGNLNEIVEVAAQDPGRHFRARIDHPGHDYWHGALPLHRSPFISNVGGSLIVPLFDTVTEFRSICLALLYALSIVVRYRPSIWRRVQEGDLDQYRALIESFLSVAERILPEQFLATILGIPVYTRQPGTL
jgi:YaaC-like Protein